MRKQGTVFAICALIGFWLLIAGLLVILYLDGVQEEARKEEPLVARYTVVTEYGTFANVDHRSHRDGVAKLFLSDGSVVWVSGSYLMIEN